MINHHELPEAMEAPIKKSKIEKPIADMSREELLAELAEHHFDNTLPDITGDFARDIHAKFISKTDESRSSFPEYNINDMSIEELRTAVEILRLNANLDTAISAEKS